MRLGVVYKIVTKIFIFITKKYTIKILLADSISYIFTLYWINLIQFSQLNCINEM